MVLIHGAIFFAQAAADGADELLMAVKGLPSTPKSCALIAPFSTGFELSSARLQT